MEDESSQPGVGRATFFNPHPGLLGAAVRIPEPIRLVANQLVGSGLTVEEAVENIREQAQYLVEEGEYDEYEVKVHPGCILLVLREADTRRRLCWRVIEYER
jgi:hypothetical protein